MRKLPTSLLTLLLLVASCSPGSEPLSGLLITLDTTRQDALSCYGAPAGVTPHLDKLAAEGVRYDQARATTPLTTPSHASMLTGLTPPRHTVRDNHLMRLPDSAQTLAERARDGGYETAAFLAAVVLDESFGLAQGFDAYDLPPRRADDPLAHFAERSGEAVVDSAIAWLRQRSPDRPFFAWVHLFDAHAPYRPDASFLSRTGGDRYLGEVAAQDAAVGRLIDELRRSDRLDRTLILVVGDHGEGLGDHGESTHGTYVYDSTLKVPFLLRDPSGHRAGTSSDEIVSVVDVFPTFLDAFGLGSPSDIDGVSLFRGEVPADRGMYFESYYASIKFGWSPIVGWADAGGKYVHAGRSEWFDLRDDPRELSAGAAPDSARYRDAIQAQLARTVLPRERVDDADPELLDQLSALGYVAVGESLPELPDPFDDLDRPSPLDRVDLLARFLEATEAGLAGRYADATDQLREILVEDPDNASATDYLAFFLMQQGRHVDARELLERLVATGPARSNTVYNLGVCLEKLGDPERALLHYRRALEIDPGHVGAKRDVARLGG